MGSGYIGMAIFESGLRWAIRVPQDLILPHEGSGENK